MSRENFSRHYRKQFAVMHQCDVSDPTNGRSSDGPRYENGFGLVRLQQARKLANAFVMIVGFYIDRQNRDDFERPRDRRRMLHGARNITRRADNHDAATRSPGYGR